MSYYAAQGESFKPPFIHGCSVVSQMLQQDKGASCWYPGLKYEAEVANIEKIHKDISKMEKVARLVAADGTGSHVIDIHSSTTSRGELEEMREAFRRQETIPVVHEDKGASCWHPGLKYEAEVANIEKIHKDFSKMEKVARLVAADGTGSHVIDIHTSTTSRGELEEMREAFRRQETIPVVHESNMADLRRANDRHMLIAAKKNLVKSRQRSVIFRLFLYMSNFIVHACNLVVMHIGGAGYRAEDPNVKRFLEMKLRFLTTWIVLLHIAYSVVAFSNDWYEFSRLKRRPVAAALKPHRIYIRDTLFAAVIWPISMLVCTFFWSLYLYDRSLIFPEYIDQIITLTSNHIIHTWIAVFAILELVLRMRLPPDSRAFHLKHVTGFMVLYVYVFYYTLYYEHIWLYPVFKVAFEFGYFIFTMFHLAIFCLTMFYYNMQWCLNYLIHEDRTSVIINMKPASISSK